MGSAVPRSVLVTFCVTVTASYGVLYYAFTVLAPEISRDTGWSHTALMAAFSLSSVVSGVIGVLVGRHIQKSGPRVVMTMGGIVGSAGAGMLAWAPTYWWFAAGMMLCGLGSAGLFYAPSFATLTHWYGNRRVEAITALTLVAGFASTIFAPLTVGLLEVFDWRTVYLVFAVGLFLLTVPAHAVVLDRPWRTEARDSVRVNDRAVLASTPFVMLAVGSTLITLAVYASVVSLIPLLTSRDLSSSLAAWALGLGGAGQVLGRLLYPPLARSMEFHQRVLIITMAVALTIAALTFSTEAALVIMLISIAAGAARGLFTLVEATVVSDLWGSERYASLNGALGAPVAIAAAVGPFAGAWFAEVLGGYAAAFWILGGIAILGAGFTALATAQQSAPMSAVSAVD